MQQVPEQDSWFQLTQSPHSGDVGSFLWGRTARLFPLGSKSAEDRITDWDMGGERQETGNTFLPNMLRFPYSCLLCADDYHHSFLDEEDKRCQQEGA